MSIQVLYLASVHVSGVAAVVEASADLHMALVDLDSGFLLVVVGTAVVPLSVAYELGQAAVLGVHVALGTAQEALVAFAGAVDGRHAGHS